MKTEIVLLPATLKLVKINRPIFSACFDMKDSVVSAVN